MTKFFSYVFSLRYLAVLAVIAPVLGAILMFILGAGSTLTAFLIFFGVEETEGIEQAEAIMIELVESIDHFLFAAVLMIFAIGLYALFFRTSSKHSTSDSHRKSLSWNQLKKLGGMDEMLLKVIIMLLAVSFLEFTIRSGLDALEWTALVIPLAIIALAIGLKWMSDAAEEDVVIAAENSVASVNYLSEVERLADLRDRGALTQSEFEMAKRHLLYDPDSTEN